MRYLNIVTLIFMVLIAKSMNAQDLERYKWENRLVLILTDQPDSEKYRKQVEELKSHRDGIRERKILVYHITPEHYKEGLPEDNWQKAETDYSQYKKTDSQPEIILIGLDGGIKLRAEEFLSARELFATIDAMPMRRQEINRQKDSQ